MKTIIIYTTKYGSVEKAAKILESKLASPVTLVNIMKDTPPSLDPYDNVILGGSIYVGRIQKKLTDFINGNLSTLFKKRVGLFICAGSPDPEARKKELETTFPSEIYNHAVSKKLFGYEINYEKLSFLDKLIMKAVKGDKNGVSEVLEENIAELAKTITSKA